MFDNRTCLTLLQRAWHAKLQQEGGCHQLSSQMPIYSDEDANSMSALKGKALLFSRFLLSAID